MATELTDTELLEVVQEVSGNKDLDGSEDESDLPSLSPFQKMLMVDYLRKFVQESGLHTSIVKEIETVVSSEANASKRKRTLDSNVCSALVTWCNKLTLLIGICIHVTTQPSQF